MIMEQATALQELLPLVGRIRLRWEPVEKILSLNGIQLMLRVIAYSYEWNYSGRYENWPSLCGSHFFGIFSLVFLF